AGCKRRTLLDGLLEGGLRVVEVLLFEGFHAFENEELGLSQPCAKLVQAVDLVEFFLPSFGLSLRMERDAEIVVRLLEIGLDGDGALECGDRSGKIVGRFQFHAQIVLRFGISRIEFRGFAKLGERSWVISLTAENSSKQQPRGGELGIELDGAMAVRGGF